ncbi:MAG: tetratricopeptide repeat protein [Pirellulaceae bacterium]
MSSYLQTSDLMAGRRSWSDIIVCSMLLVPLVLVPAASFASIQESTTTQQELTPETAEEKSERVAAERFLDLLKKRPRLGTALDKVYGYHVGRGTLEAFVTKLEADATASNEGNLWLILGMVQMQRGQDALGAQALERAEQLLPAEPLASYYLGKSLVLTGEVDKAADAMRRAIERKPARADMLQIFQDLGRIFQRTGRNQEALEVWSQLEAMYPGDTGVQEQIAAILAEEGADQSALERYTALAQSLTDQFRKIEMGVRAAQLQAKLGNSEKALSDFEKLLATVNPDSWLYRDIRSRIEEVFWVSNDFDGLVKYYTDWTEKHPDDVDAMMRTARVLSIQKRTPEALTWFRKAIERAPSNIEVRRALVETLVAENEFGQAATEMEQLVALEPNNPDAIVRWGELVMSEQSQPAGERRQKAADIWKRLLESRADDPVTLARVADLLRGAELVDLAIEHYRKAISLAENEPQYREYLGEFLHQLGRKDEALATWEELASGDRKTRDNLVRLSEVLSTFSYPERALETIAAACEMKPDFGHRVRYAELLRDAGRNDDSLAQLDLSESLADDLQERELVISERIKSYVAAGTLVNRIEELENDVAEKSKSDAIKWRLLALLREANRQFQPACEAIEQATTLSPDDAVIWESAAGLYERTGRFGEASAAYRKLSTLDRRYLTNYLTQIASLEMRLGNVESALAAGDELLAAAPGNSESYRFFAELCSQAGQVNRGLEMLRRNVRTNPNDADTVTYLAKSLADEFQTDEAIELYWRTFDLAKDIETKMPIIESLAGLYLRTDRFDSLLDRLSVISREANKTRDGLLWIAGAHQAAGDLGMARQMLEQLVREDSRDTKLLEQLVKLSRSEFDFQSAAEYQKRLVAISPTPEGEYALANLLMEIGEIDQAEGLWMKLTQRNRDNASIQSTVSSLINKGQIDTAAKLVEQAMQREPNNWELCGQALLIYVKTGKLDQAQEVAQRVLAMKIPAGTLSELMQKARATATTKKSPNPNAVGVEYYDSLDRPLNIAGELIAFRQSVGLIGDSYSFSRGLPLWSAKCFGALSAVAEGMELLAIKDVKARESISAKMIESALAGNDRDLLWKAVRFQAWIDTRTPDDTKSNPAQACIEKLAELGDADAAISVLTSIYSRRINLYQPTWGIEGGAAQKIEPMPRAELEKLLKLRELAKSAPTAQYSYLNNWMSVELRKAGMDAEANQVHTEMFGSVTEPYEKFQMAVSMTQQLVSGDSEPEKIAEQNKAIREIMIEAFNDATGKSMNTQYMSSSLAQSIPVLCQTSPLDDVIKIAHAAIGLQARMTAEMRPSQRDRSQSGSQPASYYRVLSGRGQSFVVKFPPPTAYFDSGSIAVLNSLFQSAKESGPEGVEKLKAACESWVAEKTDDPFLTYVHVMAKASVEYWADDRAATEKTLEQLATLNVGIQTNSLMQIRLKYDSGDIRGALTMVDALRPANQNMLVDRELTRLQLLLQLGDLEMSRESARKLFALRLASDTEFKLADLMHQLGMKEMGDRMMERIRRKAGGKQETLSRLMQSYATAGNMDAASEIARQIVRRTKPPASRNYRTSEDAQFEQALQILVRAGKIEPLIAQYEKLVERSPRAVQLSSQLAAFYEAAGRRTDAQKLLLTNAEKSPTDPQSLFAAGQALAAAGDNAKAVEKYLEALRKSPDMLNNNYYEMRSAFDATKGWSKLIDMMQEVGFAKFSQSYRLQEIGQQLVQYKEYAVANKLVRGLIEGGNIAQVGSVLENFRYGGEFKADDDLAKLLVDKILASAATQNQIRFSGGRSSNGSMTGSVDSLVGMVKSNKAECERLVEGLKKQLAEDANSLFPRATLGLIAVANGEYEQVDELIAPLLASEKKSPLMMEAIWCIASRLAEKQKSPERAVTILESLDLNDDQAWGQNYGSRMNFGPVNLLVYACENSNQMERAKTHLLRMLSEAKVDEQQNQANPGYGEYQFLESMDSLSLKLIAANCPIEAYIAYSRSFANSEMVAAAAKWGGSDMTARGQRILASIQAKLTAETVLKTVRQACAGVGSIEENSTFLSNVEFSGNSLANANIGLPLEVFVARIKKDEQLQISVSDWLSKLPAEPAPKFEYLLNRIVVCKSLENPDLTSTLIGHLRSWMSENPPPDWSRVAEEKGPKSESGDVENGVKDDSRSALINRELSLAIAARNLPATSKEELELIERLTNRAMDAARAAHKDALLFAMKYQLAKAVAVHDQEAASKLFLESLDELFPPAKPEGDKVEKPSIK